MPPTIPTPSQLATAGPDQAPHAGHAHARRDRAPRAARPPLAHRARAAALRHHARRRLHRRRAQLPGRAGDHRRARHAHLQGGRRAHQRARARAARRRHRARATASRSCAATTAAGSTPCSPARKLGANALFLNTAFSRPAADRRRQAREAQGGHLRPRVRRGAQGRRRRGASATSPGTTPRTARPRTRALEDLIARGDTAPLDAPERAGPRDHPHLRHDRHAEGRLALDAEVDRPDRLAAVRDPAASAREKTMIAAPLFHAWGFAQWALGISLATTVVLKRKFDEEATLSLTAQHQCAALVVVPVMIQRILELDDEVLDRYDLSQGARRAGLAAPRCPARSPTAGWTTSARTSTTSTARPRSPGRRSPRRATCARRPAPSAARRAAAS